MPPRRHRLGLERPAGDREPVAAARAPRRGRRRRRRSAPSAMSPAMPEKQWNQATVSTGPAAQSWSASRPHGQGAEHGAGRAEPVVDADDGDARRRTTRAWPAARSRPRARRRSRRWWARRRPGAGVSPPTRLASAPSMPATTTTASAVGERVGDGQQPVDAGDADVGEARRVEAVGGEGGGALVGHGQVGGAGGDDHDPLGPERRPGATRAVASRRRSSPRRVGAAMAAVGLRGVGPGQEDRAAARGPAARRRSRAHCSGVLPGP